MKKKIIAIMAGVACFGAAGVASAADMAVKARPAPVAAVFNWTGFYIGAQAGYGWDRLDYTTNDHGGGNGNLESVRLDGSGWLAGGQLGYRWQTGAFVFGVEGAGLAAGIRGSGLACGVGTGALPCTVPVVNVAAGFLQTRSTEIRALYSITGSLGYTWNRTLLYVKGGWAGADVRTTNSETFNGANVCLPANGFNSCASASRSAWGGTVGGGIEYAVTDNFSLGAEYSYYRLTTDPVSVVSITGNPSTFGGVTADIHTITGRANFKLFSPPAAVVARY